MNTVSTTEKTSTTAIHVANYLIGLKQGSYPVDLLRINKMVYIVFGWISAIRGDVFLFDDRIEAWPYGPVIPSIYHSFKHNGVYKITEKCKELDDNFDSYVPDLSDSEKNSPTIIQNVKTIWSAYKNSSSSELVGLTHAQDTPWEIAYKKGKHGRNIEIKKEDIREYYKGLHKKMDR